MAAARFSGQSPGSAACSRSGSAQLQYISPDGSSVSTCALLTVAGSTASSLCDLHVPRVLEAYVTEMTSRGGVLACMRGHLPRMMDHRCIFFSCRASASFPRYYLLSCKNHRRIRVLVFGHGSWFRPYISMSGVVFSVSRVNCGPAVVFAAWGIDVISCFLMSEYIAYSATTFDTKVVVNVLYASHEARLPPTPG